MLSLYRELQRGQYTPRCLGEVTCTLAGLLDIKHPSALVVNHMTQSGVELIHRLAASPVKLLTGIVLVIACYGYLRHSGYRVGKIHDDAVEDRQRFAGFVVVWEA